MKLNVFACNGGYLLSDECMFAPREATEAHRPVVAMLGLVECDELPAPLGERVTRDIERQLFAFVPTDEAKQLRRQIRTVQHPPTIA